MQWPILLLPFSVDFSWIRVFPFQVLYVLSESASLRFLAIYSICDTIASFLVFNAVFTV